MNQTDKMGIIALSIVVLIVGAMFLFVYSITPRYYGDASVYTYKVVVSDVWFAAKENLDVPTLPRVHLQRETYYVNGYEVKKNKYGEPIDFRIGAGHGGYAYFVQGADGNYRLVYTENVIWGFSPEWHRNITVIRQSDNNVVFDSTEALLRANTGYGP